MKVFSSVCSLGILISSISFTTISAQESADVNDWTLSISPLYLVLPAARLSAEHSVSEDAGFGGMITFGSSDGVGLFGAGVFGNYYLIGDFDHGMILGGQLTYAYAAASIDNVSATANGLGVGPYVGYKLALGFGLTTSLEVGGSFLLVHASASDDFDRVSTSGSGFGLTLDWKVGWSF